MARCPLDIQASMINLELSESDDNDSGSADAGIDEIQIESVLGLIKQARRPLILAGHWRTTFRCCPTIF